QPALGNGLLGTMYRAYSQHIPLRLRPDDLWLAILFNFGRYVKHHSEELRHLFVDHQGRRQLTISVQSPYLQYTTQQHWENFIGLMTAEIQKNTKNQIADWMMHTF